METEQFKKMSFKEDAAMKVMSTCHLYVKIKVAIMKTEKMFLSKSNAELLAILKWKNA